MSAQRLIVFVALLFGLTALGCSDTAITIGDGDNTGRPCDSDDDCDSGSICDDGYCSDPEAPDGDKDLDPTDGDMPDGDVPDGDVPLSCSELGGECTGRQCPADMRATFDSAGCVGRNAICCVANMPIQCEQMGGYCVGRGIEAACGSGYDLIQNPSGCESLFGQCCSPRPEPCLEIGDIGQTGRNCCEGLMRIPSVYADPTEYIWGACLPLVDDCPDCFSCSRCGNGVCGQSEDYCSCQEDCPFPETGCSTDADCQAAYCLDDPESDGACVQVIPYCNAGYCETWSETYPGSFCAGTACTPYACDPGDTVPYTCWEGTVIPVCTCSDAGQWQCQNDLDSACPAEPLCRPGQEIQFECETGDWVDWCRCEGSCQPVCAEIGTRSEGWYDSCSGELLGWAQCAGCSTRCSVEGERGEVWVESCGGLVVTDGPCNGAWDCVDDPEVLCAPGPNPCMLEGGLCMNAGGECPQNWSATPDIPCPGSDFCCLPAEPPNPCVLEGGVCIHRDDACPPNAYGTNIPCDGARQICCMKDEWPRCEDAGGLCYMPTDQYMCPEGYQSTSGVWYECGNGGLCCFPQSDNACEVSGGLCIGWGPICPDGTTTYEPIGCPDYAGACCLPDDPFECQAMGGHCGDPDEPCSDGYAPINNPAGCVGYSSMCCVPDGSVCTIDAQCGESACEWMDFGACRQYDSRCLYGECVSAELVIEDANCIYGDRCEPVGECQQGQIRYAECSDGTTQPWCHCETSGRWDCDNIVSVCGTGSPNSCMEMGGVCASWYNGCPTGTAEVDSDCGDLACAGGCLCCLATP